VILRDPGLIHLANQFLPPHETSDSGFGQKRLFLLVYLSPLNTAYQAARQGLYGKGASASRAQLAFVVRDDDAFWVTQNQGYDPDFMALCREVREEVVIPGTPAA
jgi:hypothetical protein